MKKALKYAIAGAAVASVAALVVTKVIKCKKKKGGCCCKKHDHKHEKCGDNCTCAHEEDFVQETPEVAPARDVSAFDVPVD